MNSTSVCIAALILNCFAFDGEGISGQVQVNSHFPEGKRILYLATNEARLLVCSAHALVTNPAVVCPCTFHIY